MHKVNALALCLLVLSLPGLYSTVAIAEDIVVDEATAEALKGNPFLVEKPRWEVGVGAAALSLEAYPASSVTTERAFALPFFLYRGSRIRLQQGNLSAIAVENRRFKLDVSVGAALNVDSDDVPIRAGLPDLDFLFQIGPKLELRLWDKVSTSVRRRQKLTLDTSFRAALSTDLSSIQSQGYLLNTQLSYEYDGFLTPKTTLRINGGPVWATDKLGDFIYGVDEQFALPNRPAFEGRSGYLATNAIIGLQHKFTERFQVFAALGLGVHTGAANRDSALFENNVTTGIALGVAWTIKASKNRVLVLD